ncbi:serine/threonine-protein kinase [Hymenobacter convexus]|uniref:serine/threonine-protein kinase n=1 Tax=Hymenobacter sp. CA1UV-4 TaxID=3063782 RepID=UPI002713E0C1|nr:serine/threonine-protein kinase [Hymenobacter sp. CA1UV-4]MDO7850389.1 serine/threonine-protein kinase [Hymenobacter sp. CA1UV-4]
MAFPSLSTTASLDFELTREIGQQGKNSTVFVAHDKQLDAEIVIKKIEKARLPAIEEFFAEAKRLYDSSHQHVVQIKYACQDDQYIYLAMPLYARGSLKTLIDARFLTVREIIRYALQFLQGLHNIHVKGLVHFDIKPDNILLSDSNEALVADFGITGQMNQHGMAQPGLNYALNMPPEVFAQLVHSSTYDIYSAGVALYRLCNGNQVFYSQSSRYSTQDELKEAIITGGFPDRKEYPAHIPMALRKAINKAMDIDQAKRPDTVLDLINLLSPIDQLLDWSFTPSSGQDEWTLETDSSIFSVIFTSNANRSSVSTTKFLKRSQKRQNVSKGTFDVSGLSAKEIGKQIQALLLSLE